MTVYNVIRYFKGYIIKDVPAESRAQALEKFIEITTPFMEQTEADSDIHISWDGAHIEPIN